MPKTKDEHVRASIRYLAAIKKFIDDIPRQARGVATAEAAEHLVTALQVYPAYKFYGRPQAYPQAHLQNPGAWIMPNGKMHTPVPGYFSLKQFHYVMSLRSKYDFGYPHRTGRLRRGWRVEGTGAKTRVTNNEPSAKWVMGNKMQAAQPRGAGWKKMNEIAEQEAPAMAKIIHEVVMRAYPYKRKAP